MPTGQVTWESAGYGTNDYIVLPETEKNIFSEYRKRGIIGKISRTMKQQTIGSGPNAREMDVAGTACVMTKTIKSGDEVRFTMQRNITGSPTYGDAAVLPGDFLAYMHATVFLNSTDSPEIPLIGEMAELRVADVLSSQDSAVRHQINMWLAEEQAYKFYDAVFTGMSRDLSTPRAQGGRALDLGLGAGVQVSPENYIVAGSGPVSGNPGSSGYETNLNTALDGLTNTAGDMISVNFLHNLPRYLAQTNIGAAQGMDGTPESKYICLCDPDLLVTLTAPGGTLSNAWLGARERTAKNPFFVNDEIEYKNLILVPDEYLKKYRADSSGATLWGSNLTDRREFVPSSTIAHMVILGASSVLNANNGSVKFTENPGRHGKGRGLAAHIKDSYMRMRWVPKDGSSATIKNQSMAVASFYQGALTW